MFLLELNRSDLPGAAIPRCEGGFGVSPRRGEMSRNAGEAQRGVPVVPVTVLVVRFVVV
jgi:hypothetical protein